MRLYCPMCRQLLQEIEPGPGTKLRIRCQNRHCKDRPRLTFMEDKGRMIIRALDKAPVRIAS